MDYDDIKRMRPRRLPPYLKGDALQSLGRSIDAGLRGDYGEALQDFGEWVKTLAEEEHEPRRPPRVRVSMDREAWEGPADDPSWICARCRTTVRDGKCPSCGCTVSVEAPPPELGEFHALDDEEDTEP